MNAPLPVWVVRALWATLPFTLLDHLAAATADASRATSVATQTMFWVLWTAALAASLVALPSTLTALRLLAPAAPAASLVATVAVAPGIAGWLGLVTGALATAVALSAPVGDWFADGPSYGDERRFGLRPPLALLMGPLEVTWVLAVVPLPTGVLLITSGRPVTGGIVSAIGVLSALWAFGATLRLACRWAVFVPAGLTLVDEVALAEPILLPARALGRLGPAHVGTEATDLTVAAPGLVIEADLTAPVEMTPAARTRGALVESRETDAVLFVPSRPGALLAEAERRGVAVARD